MARVLSDPRQLLLAAFEAAVGAADPLKVLAAHLPAPARLGTGRTVAVGAGKAAASMAMAVEQRWPADADLSGLVVTRYAHGLPCRRIEVLEAGHPVPDAAGEQAAERIAALAAALTPEDLLLVLVSGGGSSLLSLPVPGVPMAALKQVTQALLASGAPIQEMNIVRKHLSRIQGGRLAQLTAARVLALVVSDVAGDDLSAIASGPCAPDPSTYADAIDVLRRWNVDAPPEVGALLQKGQQGLIDETPKPGDPIFARVEHRMIATARGSLLAAAKVFEAAGIRPVVLGDTITGEARDVAQVLGALSREIAAHDSPFQRPVALLSGGECTVTLRGQGRGGRCSEFLLALARELKGVPGAWALAADTDGIDGIESNAGAVITPDTLSRADAAGLDARRSLDDNDGYGFFSALGDLVVTGPTRTNVNDFRAIVLMPD